MSTLFEGLCGYTGPVMAVCRSIGFGKNRAHPGLNRGPAGLQPDALPLSYGPGMFAQYSLTILLSNRLSQPQTKGELILPIFCSDQRIPGLLTFFSFLQLSTSSYPLIAHGRGAVCTLVLLKVAFYRAAQGVKKTSIHGAFAYLSYRVLKKEAMASAVGLTPYNSLGMYEFFGTLGDDFHKKLNSRSDLALILGVLKRYRSAEESDDPYTMHLWSQIDPIVVGKAKAI
ncbi:hypothetical protein PROFUN_03852 [Planoprotostelium fungivorum]|uniref:Uncharacterized protein n=1 Tax=Planoprotostelium fungivorum TaxID=1890364 RepID=A0A2P6NID2_9EUKA|nr:hypothetical protein PROFUN_03852 [Planoprotostelium fungivorum]